jgi:hypothetical protein
MARFNQPSMPTVAFNIGTPFSIDKQRGMGQIALGELRKEDLERFCEVLNSAKHPELREHLRELVKAWQDSGPNLEKMIWGSHKHLHNYLEALYSRVSWMPTTGGRAMLFIIPAARELAELVGQERVYRQKPNGTWMFNSEAEAWIEFGLFTLNPHCEELAGPCARCGNYYVKKRASQKVYCSRRCGNAATAVVRTAERIADEREGKIVRAKAAMKKWGSTATRQDWKDWVAQKTGIDPRFLTRAVTKGDLVPPQKKR